MLLLPVLVTFFMCPFNSKEESEDCVLVPSSKCPQWRLLKWSRAASELAPIPSPLRPTSITLPGVPSALGFPQGLTSISACRFPSTHGHSRTDRTLMQSRNWHSLEPTATKGGPAGWISGEKDSPSSGLKTPARHSWLWLREPGLCFGPHSRTSLQGELCREPLQSCMWVPCLWL